MTETPKLAVSPRAVAETQIIMRQAADDRATLLERQLLVQINERVRLERVIEEKDQIIARLEHINAAEGDAAPVDEDIPNA